MPEKEVLDRAKKDAREGKSPSTQAGEFVREEFDHIREGKHGARSAKQAIAIGLSKARRAGIALKAPKAGTASKATRIKAERDVENGKASAEHKVSSTRSRATMKALQREGSSSASHLAVARQARSAARKRTPANRRSAAQKAVRPKARSTAAHKPAGARGKRVR